MKLSTSRPKFQLPPEGFHIASLIRFEDKGEQPNRFEEGKTQHVVELLFSIAGDNGPINQYAWVSASLHEKSRLFGIVRALLGKKPEGVIDLNDLVGLRCQVEIEHYSSNGKRRSKIVSYRPVPNPQGVHVDDSDIPF